MNCPECNCILETWKNDLECFNPECRINYLRIHYKKFTVKKNISQKDNSWKQGQKSTGFLKHQSQEVA